MPARRTSADILAEQIGSPNAPTEDEQPRRRVTRLNHGPSRPTAERRKLDSADILARQITGVNPR